mmetsp:Transcript_112994/g.330257  ORF Transcript_112994/g.330257 Transcript_112994/m.330257 type:complete len:335 (-) Transcript_112994:356-1360(-)
MVFPDVYQDVPQSLTRALVKHFLHRSRPAVRRRAAAARRARERHGRDVPPPGGPRPPEAGAGRRRRGALGGAPGRVELAGAPRLGAAAGAAEADGQAEAAAAAAGDCGPGRDGSPECHTPRTSACRGHSCRRTPSEGPGPGGPLLQPDVQGAPPEALARLPPAAPGEEPRPRGPHGGGQALRGPGRTGGGRRDRPDGQRHHGGPRGMEGRRASEVPSRRRRRRELHAPPQRRLRPLQEDDAGVAHIPGRPHPPGHLRCHGHEGRWLRGRGRVLGGAAGTHNVPPVQRAHCPEPGHEPDCASFAEGVLSPHTHFLVPLHWHVLLQSSEQCLCQHH